MPEWTHLQIVAFYAALNAIIGLLLAFNAGRVRGKTKILLGDGNNEEMTRAMRAHANFAEYVPLALILLTLLALLQTSTSLLHGLGIALTVARAVHGYGLASSGGLTPPRAIGAVLTHLTIITEIVLLLMRVFA